MGGIDFPQVRFLYFPVVFSTEGTGGGRRRGKRTFLPCSAPFFTDQYLGRWFLTNHILKHLSNDVMVFINKCLLNDYAK